MANCMKEVAKMLGLELGETFRITKDNDERIRYFRLTKEGIIVSQDSVRWSDDTTTFVLEDILAGRAKVATLPWKPKNNEVYYIPRIHPNDSFMWLSATWEGNNADNKLYQLGLVCVTREEAIAMTKKMIAGLEKKKQ